MHLKSWRTYLMLSALALASATGCGTTRLTDTARTATEQLLVSNAIDQAISDLDFRSLAGKTVFFDPQYLDGVVDRGYVVSSIRQQLLASGCFLQEERTKADYVVEARTGAIGTDRHALLVGVPQMNVPTFVPGQPSQIPEIPFAKKTDQEAVAKVAVFAYNRLTGQPLWQSGVVKAFSTSKDMWVLGAGPFQFGTIRKGPEFAGEPILAKDGDKPAGANPAEPAAMTVTQEALWLDALRPKTDSKRLAYLLGAIPASERPTNASSAETDSFTITAHAAQTPAPTATTASNSAAAAAPTPPPPSVETEPGKIITSAGEPQPAPTQETEPGSVLDTTSGFQPDH